MRVEKLLKRLKREFLKVNLMQACLDSILFFLSANIVLFLLDFSLVGSVDNKAVIALSSLAFFGADFYYRSKNYTLEIYEQKNPELREILRTARDNLNSRNIVSQALFDELMDRSRSVTSESIVPSKRIIQKILAVGALSFITVISGIANFQVLDDSGELINDLGPIDDVLNQEKEREQRFQVQNASNIEGSRDIKLSGKLVNYSIEGTGNPESSDLSANPVSRPARLDSTGPELSEDLELAKQYSLEIKSLD
ncbi:MAG: hypothetical protein H8Z69_00310 [Nanohaloarchaea archaeon]|nr:hypothetical protein [Candidatus Nanohaloarchaea archaeon]